MRKSFTVLIIRSFFHLSCTSLPTGELESLQPALKELVSTIILLHEDASQRSGFSQHTGTTPNGTIERSAVFSAHHCALNLTVTQHKTDPAVIQNTTEGKDPTHKIQSPPWSQTFLHINHKHCFTNHEIHVLIRSAPD